MCTTAAAASSYYVIIWLTSRQIKRKKIIIESIPLRLTHPRPGYLFIRDQTTGEWRCWISRSVTPKALYHTRHTHI